MKIQGYSSLVATASFTLPKNGSRREITFLLRALPMDYSMRLAEELPPPSVERLCDQLGIGKDENGQPIREGGTFKWVHDLSTPRYQKAVAEHQMLSGAATIYFGLTDDMTVSWEVTPEAYPKKKDFYNHIFQEMNTAGLSIGDMLMLQQRIMELSNIDKDRMDEVKRDFSRASQAMESAGSPTLQ